MQDIYGTIMDMKTRGVDMVVVTVTMTQGSGPATPGKKMVVTPDLTVGTVGGGALEHEAIKKARELILTRSHETKTYVLHEGGASAEGTALPMVCGGTVTLFFEYVGVRGHIIVFGAGHVGKALVKALHPLGFAVTVVDDREDVLQEIEGADRLVAMPFVKAVDHVGIPEGSYVVIATPSHTADYHVINKILADKLKPTYIGMLCSPAKLKDYLESTYRDFGPDVNLDNLYAPVGLDLGGGSPEDIAVSIVSEILAIHHGKTGHRHMRKVS